MKRGSKQRWSCSRSGRSCWFDDDWIRMKISCCHCNEVFRFPGRGCIRITQGMSSIGGSNIKFRSICGILDKKALIISQPRANVCPSCATVRPILILFAHSSVAAAVRLANLKHLERRCRSDEGR